MGNTNSTTYVEAKTNPASTNYARAGNYFVFTGLKAASIIVEATTAAPNGFERHAWCPDQRNATGGGGSRGPSGPTVSIERTAAGLVITFEKVTLESAPAITGPMDRRTRRQPGHGHLTGNAKFYRSKQ